MNLSSDNVRQLLQLLDDTEADLRDLEVRLTGIRRFLWKAYGGEFCSYDMAGHVKPRAVSVSDEEKRGQP